MNHVQNKLVPNIQMQKYTIYRSKSLVDLRIYLYAFNKKII